MLLGGAVEGECWLAMKKDLECRLPLPSHAENHAWVPKRFTVQAGASARVGFTSILAASSPCLRLRRGLKGEGEKGGKFEIRLIGFHF